LSIEIQKDCLRLRACTHDNIPLDYDAKLTDFLLDAPTKEKVHSTGRELRALLRSKANLEEAISAIEQLHRERTQKPAGCVFDFSHRSLFAYAAVLYGACFTKGGADREIPLREIERRLRDCNLHDVIMIHRHKLFAHLDEDHDVRTDEMNWSLVVKEEGLVPNGPRMSGVKTLLVVGETNLEWITHMKMVINMIETEVKVKSTEINSLLGDFVKLAP
jgi:hypothetical protein